MDISSGNVKLSPSVHISTLGHRQRETIENYIRHLYELAAHCDFFEKELEIQDRLVIGIRNKVQMTSDLTRKKARTWPDILS